MPIRIKASVKIPTEQYGVIEVRPLTMGDLKYYLELDRQRYSSRELSILCIHHQLISPQLSVEDLNNWSDDVLADISTKWSRNGQDFGVDLPVDKPELEAFIDAFNTFLNQRLEENRRATEAMNHKLNLLVQPMLNSLQENIQLTGKQLAQEVNISRKLLGETKQLLATIPPLEELKAELKQTLQLLPFMEADLITAELERNSKNLIPASLKMSHRSQLKRVIRVDKRVRQAVLTNHLLATTRQPKFQADLYELFHSSKAAARRWPIIQHGLKAHTERDYVLAIPALLTQVEGLLADLLVLRQEIQIQKGRVYALDSSGKPKLNKKGKQIEVRGLGELVRMSSNRLDRINGEVI
jgi:hypothetical protein